MSINTFVLFRYLLKNVHFKKRLKKTKKFKNNLRNLNHQSYFQCVFRQLLYFNLYNPCVP